MLLGLLAALLAAVLFGVGAVVQAVAVRSGGLLSWRTGGVVVLYVLGWLLHLVAIALVPLYVAQVGTSASLAVTAVVAGVLVHEPLAPRHWVAVVTLVGGLALLALAAGGVGDRGVGPTFVLVLLAAVLVLLVLGRAALAWRHRRSGVALGVVAGLAYSGTPLASRAVVDPSWDLVTLGALLALLLHGVLGFWLYSLAMRRTSVTGATAPLVLLQTVVPAAVGVLVLGDAIRDGWWPVALVGLVAGTAGALALTDAEHRLDHLERAHDPMVG